MEKYNEKGELLHSPHHDKMSLSVKIGIAVVIGFILLLLN